MHLELTWVLKKVLQDLAKGDFVTLKESCVPVKKVKKNGIKYCIASGSFSLSASFPEFH